MNKLIIFDFDGVIVDSEVLANAVLAEVVSEFARPMTTDEAMSIFMGKRFSDVIATVDKIGGRPTPVTLPDDFQARTLARFRLDLKEVPGFRAYVDEFRTQKRCIASSSSPDRLAMCLELLRLDQLFGEHVFSASQVAHGKPHPDIFLHAARAMQVEPADAIVIEDSAGGVRGAVAAGMTAIGLLAGSHIRSGHAEALMAAGAGAIARDYDEAATLTRAWLAGEPLLLG